MQLNYLFEMTRLNFFLSQNGHYHLHMALQCLHGLSAYNIMINLSHSKCNMVYDVSHLIDLTHF
jgi:hypothetical protein